MPEFAAAAEPLPSGRHPRSPRVKSPAGEVSFREACRLWFRIGWISFGGSAGQVALLHRELVDRRGWLEEARFVHALQFCMMLPGPEAQQLATYCGWLLHGVRGALVAGTLFVLPSVLILFALSFAYLAWGEMPLAVGLLRGLKPVVVALILVAGARLSRRTLHAPWQGILALLVFLGVAAGLVPYPLLVALAGGVGWGLYRWQGKTGPLTEGPEAEGPEVGGEEAGRRVGAGRILAVAVFLWALPLLALVLSVGTGSRLVEMYRFFTGAAFVTFGGAYAVLSYASSAAVGWGWLTLPQAVDGLGLAEVTPGPLVIVLQFFGTVAAWQAAPEGVRLAHGVAGGLVATWATFLPSITLVLLGAPHVERLRGRPSVAGMLAGVGAAVMGVMAHLAFTFGQAVLWPAGQFDGAAAAIGLAALAWFGSGRVGLLAPLLAGAGTGLLLARWAG